MLLLNSAAVVSCPCNHCSPRSALLATLQYVMPSAPAAAQHPAAATYRVRKRRAVEAAEFSLADLGPQYVVWGRSKRRRSQLPKRLAKTSAQLRSSLQRVLASGAQIGNRRPPAAATGSQPAQQQQLHHPVQSGAPREQHPQQQLQQPAQSLPQPASNQVKAGTPPNPQLQIDKQAAAAAADQAAPAAVDRQVAQPVQAQAVQQQSKTPEEQQEQPAAQKQAPEAPVQQVSDSTGAKEGQQQELPPPQPMQATTAAASQTPSDVHAKPAQKEEPAAQEEEQQAQQVSKVAEPAGKQPQSQQHAAQEQHDKQQVQQSAPSAAATTDTIASRLRGSKKAAGQQQKAQPEELQQQQPAQQKQKLETVPDGAPPTKKPRTSDKGTAGSAATPAPAVASDSPAAASPAKATAATGEAAAAKDAQTADKKPAAAKPAVTAAKGAATGKATAAVKQEPAAKATPAAKASPAAKAAVSPVKPVSAGKEAQPVKPAAAAAAKTAAAGSKAGPAVGKQAAPAEAPPAAAQPAAPAEAAPAAVKPESPPSETSHQQPIAATVPQHMQQLQPPLQPLVPQLPQEQTAVSRDRSQCSLQAPAESPAAVASAGAAGGLNAGSTATPAVASAEYGAHATSGMAGGAAQHRRQLLELEASSMTPAALALGNLQVPIVPTSFKSGLPDRPFRDQDEACRHLDVLLSDARKKKHAGDARNKQQVGWDVHSLTYYAHSALEFLRYWDACHKALKQLQEAHLPVDVLKKRTQGLTSIGLLKQVSTLCANALQNASNCKGQDVQKQALRMLLERLCAICQLRHLHSQRENLQLQANLLKGTVPVTAGNGSGSSKAQQQQQQQGQRVAPGRPPAHAAPVASSGTSPGGKQAFNKRSPDDSNTSNQDRVQLSGMLGPEHSPGVVTGNSPGGGSGGNGAAGASLAAAGGGAAASQERMLMVAESTCAEHLSDMLKITDGMHQTVMRMQQFLESPEVLADEDARAAALHISTLGLDAGMFSIPRVIAHAEAALVCVVRSGRRGMVRMAS